MGRALHLTLLAAVIGSVAPAATTAATESLCRLTGASYDAVELTNLSAQTPPSHVQLPSYAGRVALSPDGERLYVPTDQSLTVIKVRTLRPIATIGLASRPDHYTVGPDGTLYVVQPDDVGWAVHVLDPRGRPRRPPLPLPGFVDIRSLSVGDRGRLLFVHGNDGSFYLNVRIIDLSGGGPDVDVVVPEPWFLYAALEASPTGPYAYVTNVRKRGQSEGGTWVVPHDGDPFAIGATVVDGADVVFGPDGTHAYLVQTRNPDSGPPTLLVDTTTHAVIAELPAGAIAGFAADGCVLVAAGRTPRLACRGDARTRPLDAALLDPRSYAPNIRDIITPTTWTAGPCQAPPRPCSDGAPCLELTGGRGVAGDTVEIAGRLRSGSVPVAALQVDVYVARSTPLAMLTGGGPLFPSPACRINPDIGKDASAFVCIEEENGGCATFRSLILSLLDVEPIADGAQLFTCTVPLPADVPVGRHRIACGNGEAATPEVEGFPLPCAEGAVEVVADEGTRPLFGAADQGGCQVAAPARPGAPLLLLPALLWLAARRRSSSVARRA